MSQTTGKSLIIIGVIIVIFGILIYLFSEKLQWLGRLPGDIRIEKDNFRLFFPITTMIALSIFVNLVLWLARKLL
jgi:H+/Cl- antiporter ClcA